MTLAAGFECRTLPVVVETSGLATGPARTDAGKCGPGGAAVWNTTPRLRDISGDDRSRRESSPRTSTLEKPRHRSNSCAPASTITAWRI